ncbi:ABC transporter substrate-binding protein [Natrialbaceae archaeon A-CW2]|uniref:ABC transporter substrate-binding protein n=1 Tax=Natronosalvus amylolyticus TaxID=2961994 RepID=UPI0020C9EF78|nr:ABC transporter substrate-binding protein [Natronosalvus amylolyticus]
MANSHSQRDYSDVLSRRTFVTLTGATGAAAVAGCMGGDDDDDSPGDQDDGNGDTNGDTGVNGAINEDYPDVYFEMCEVGNPVEGFTYNPYAPDGTSSKLELVYEPYALYDTVEDEWVPALAEDWDFGGTEGTIQLRDDIEWGDGTPLDAESLMVQWTILEEREAAAFDFVEEVEVTGDYELTFRYPDGANPDIIQQAILGNYANNPPAQFEEAAENDDVAAVDIDVDEPIPSGPFELDDVSDAYHQLTPREEGHPHADNYNWGGYRMRNRGSNQAAHQSFIEQELDGIISLFAGPGVLGQFPDSLEQIQIPGAFGMGLTPNHDEGPLGQREVRQAIAHSFDRETVIQNVGPDTKVHHPAYTGLPEAVNEGWLGEDYVEEYNQYNHDPERAAELLEEAGVEAADVPAEVIVPAGWSDWVIGASTLVDNLSQAGFEATLNTLGGAYWGLMGSGDFELLCYPHNWGTDAFIPFFALRHKLLNREHPPGSWFNYPDTVEFEGEEIDLSEEVPKLASSQDEDEIQELVERLTRLVNEDLPMLVVMEKYEQHFIDRESWEFPNEVEDNPRMRVFWPMYQLPRTEDSLSGADTPGLMKCTGR